MMGHGITTKDLYDALLRKPDLHSVPELFDDILIWNLYQDAYIQAYCNRNDTCIDIVSHSVWRGSFMHWHPDEEDMLEELYALGKKGNLLVLKKSLYATEIFYMGDAGQYPLPDRREWHMGKKKWGSGRLIYLEQK